MRLCELGFAGELIAEKKLNAQVCDATDDE
jgi:hypothetical protein